MCKKCGFIFVAQTEEVMKKLPKLGQENFYGNTYTARIPAIKARQTYLIDTLDNWFGLKIKIFVILVLEKVRC